MENQLNEKQKQAIFNQFKEAVKDCKLIDSSDEYLVKWLVARNYNAEQAEKMLRTSLEWRRLNKVDDILETYQVPEVIQKYFSWGKIGKDKFGCPIYLSAYGRMDLRGLFLSVPRKDYSRFQIYSAETLNHDMRQERERDGNNNTFMTMIADAEHLSMRQISYKPAMDFETENTKIFEANYPENMRRVFVINAPKLFTIMFNMMKPFLNPATVAKVRIFGHNKEEWLAALLEEIDADQLPAFYGGTMTDPDGDPKCPSKFNMGGEVPLEYYLSKTAEPKDYYESFSIVAGAGGKKKMKFNVDRVGSIFRWEFMTEGGDIAYRVYHKTAQNEIVELVPHSRVDSNLFNEEGELECENAGKYVLEFDNTFSIVKMKRIRYFITVEPPSSASLTKQDG